VPIFIHFGAIHSIAQTRSKNHTHLLFLRFKVKRSFHVIGVAISKELLVSAGYNSYNKQHVCA